MSFDFEPLRFILLLVTPLAEILLSREDNSPGKSSVYILPFHKPTFQVRLRSSIIVEPITVLVDSKITDNRNIPIKTRFHPENDFYFVITAVSGRTVEFFVRVVLTGAFSFSTSDASKIVMSLCIFVLYVNVHKQFIWLMRFSSKTLSHRYVSNEFGKKKNTFDSRQSKIECICDVYWYKRIDCSLNVSNTVLNR